jgi:uncharacterized protein YhfF
MATMPTSIKKIWFDFIEANPIFSNLTLPASFYFCDNEKDADGCADLVIKGIKQATCGSLWSYEQENEPLPVPGNFYIVTNWQGEAKAIIRTIKTTQVAFKDVTEEMAAMEGEGDRTLVFWRKVHWAFFSRELAPAGKLPDENMMLLFEEFETVWPVLP